MIRITAESVYPSERFQKFLFPDAVRVDRIAKIGIQGSATAIRNLDAVGIVFGAFTLLSLGSI